jgi:hypothetical protein
MFSANSAEKALDNTNGFNQSISEKAKNIRQANLWKINKNLQHTLSKQGLAERLFGENANFCHKFTKKISRKQMRHNTNVKPYFSSLYMKIFIAAPL